MVRLGVGLGLANPNPNPSPNPNPNHNPQSLWPQWAHFTTPAPTHPVIMRMAPLYLMWTTLSTLTTFVRT